MFSAWGNLVGRLRYAVLAGMVAILAALAAYGAGLGDHLSQSGWDDPGSQSVAASKLADETFGRDTNGDVILLYKAPEGSTVDDAAWQQQVSESLTTIVEGHPDQIAKANGGYFTVGTAPKLAQFSSPDRQWAIESLAVAGANDTELTANYRDVKDVLADQPGLDVRVAGLQPVAGALNDTMANDIRRMEVLAIPLVGILLFFVFGGVVAAVLPLIVGGLTVFAANGIVRGITEVTEVNTFVAPVVSLIGLGLAIDYGLFMVSRFREELADGYSVRDAVRRTVMTSGRTVVFSATMIVSSLGGLLIFPQGFLKSVAYGAIATVTLAALTSLTVLPALLSILGRRIDLLSFKALRQNKTTAEIEAGFWGRMAGWVMRNPLKVTIPIVVGLLLLITPMTGIKFGGINETYLPPDNPVRVAQEQFDDVFPGQRTEPIKVVVSGASNQQLGGIIRDASAAPGLVERFTPENPAKDGVVVLKAGLVDRNDSAPTVEYLHDLARPDGVTLEVGGTPAIEYDSIQALLHRLPIMVIVVVALTTLLMFLTFGSLVLPIKAVLLSALGLGSTLGILTWIFVDGHGAGLLNFTPGPIMSPVLVLIIAIIYGLSTDYEVFLVSRMVEARARGASTTEAIRSGIAHTGRIITAAALILIVVTGAFAFSELVMMKYIAYGMIAALVIDATLIRMGLVPAIMRLLGDDSWWAPKWMQRIQHRIGLGELTLDDAPMPAAIPQVHPVDAPPGAFAAAGVPEPILPARRTAGNAAPTTPSDDASTAGQAPAALHKPVAPTTGPLTAPVTTTPAVPGIAQSATGAPTTSRPIEHWLEELRATATGAQQAVTQADIDEAERLNQAAEEAAALANTASAPTPEPAEPASASAGEHETSSAADAAVDAEAIAAEEDSAGEDIVDDEPDEGRHHENPNAVSVSELLARNRRRDEQ